MKNSTPYWFLMIVGILTWFSYALINKLDDRLNPLPIYGVEGHQIEDFEFINQHNETFNSVEHKKQIWVVNYFFTSCPSICPKIMKNMQEVHDLLRSDDEVILLSLTVDPKRDQPERFMQYLDNYNVDHNSWQLLTGSKKDLYRLARKSFLISATDGGGDEFDFIHSENMVVLDSDQKIRGIINGTDEQADKEILKIITRLKEAA